MIYLELGISQLPWYSLILLQTVVMQYECWYVQFCMLHRNAANMSDKSQHPCLCCLWLLEVSDVWDVWMWLGFLDFLCRLVWSHTLFASRCRSHGYHATAATLAMRCPSMKWGVMETEWKAKTGRISLLTRAAATVRLAYAVSRSVKKLESWRFRLKQIQINTVYTLYIHRIYSTGAEIFAATLFVELE
jgi:hypothetical protein